MKRKVGVFFDGFDPVNAGYLEAALSAAGKLGLSFVLMGLLSGKAEESYGIRWRMLVAACSDTANLIPVRTEQECIAERMEFLQGKYPDDELVIISEPADTVSGFNNMMQAVFDDGYDLVDFETVREKYVGYFTGKTFLDSEEITRLLKDIYDAGVENQMTNRRIDAAVQNKRMEENAGCCSIFRAFYVDLHSSKDKSIKQL